MNNALVTFLKLSLIALWAVWPVSFLPAATIVHDTQAEFDAGGYSNSQFDAGNNWLELTALGQTNGSGSYTSSVIYTVTNSTWNSLSWSPQRPYYKQLPNNGASESGYPTGNVSMSGNVLLLHMNESSGTISDSSGKGNNGAAGSGVTYGATGTFNTALSFDGTNAVVTVAESGSLNTTDLTVEAWVNVETNGASTPVGTDNAVILARHGDSANGGYALGVTASGGKPYFSFENIASNTWEKRNNTTPSLSNGSSTDGRIPLGSGATRGDDYYAFPGPVIKDGNTYKIWYSAHDGSYWRIYYATSTNAGITWTKYDNTIPLNSDGSSTNGKLPLGTAGKGDSGGVRCACVIREDDGTLKMWYSAVTGSVWRIYHATSTNDGLIWTKYDNTVPAASDTTGSNGRIPWGTAGKGDETGTFGPWVIKEGNTYKMWYEGRGADTFWRRYYATSTNGGLTWTKYNNAIPANSDTTSTDGRIPLGSSGKGDSGHVFAGAAVVKDAGIYRMWYTGYGSGNYRIYYASSTNGLDWVKYNNTIPTNSNTSSPGYTVPLGTDTRGDDTHAYNPVVIKDGAVYRLWYVGGDGANFNVYHAVLNAGAPGFTTFKKWDNSLPGAFSDTVCPDGALVAGTDGKGDDGNASVGPVIKDGSVYKLWYIGNDGANWRGYHATSSNGTTWTKYNNETPTNSDSVSTDGRIPLGSSGKGDDAGIIIGRGVIKDGATYKMWYSGYDGANYRAYYATSPNGLDWTKYNNTTPTNSNTTSSNGCIPLGTAGRGDANYVYVPCVIKDDDGSFKMWYGGYNGANYRIYHATSTNGLDWTKYDNTIPTNSDTTSTNGCIPLGNNGTGDDAGTLPGGVIKDGTTYKMWYSGSDGGAWRTYYATSTNGLDWTKQDNSIPPKSDTTCSNGRISLGNTNKADDTIANNPSVIKDGATYKMWYQGGDSVYNRLLHATSSDGLTWTKYDNSFPGATDTTSYNGQVPEGTLGKGDEWYLGRHCMLKDEGMYKMWYAGRDTNGIYRIYYATSPDGFAWTKYDNTIPANSDSASSNGRIPIGSTNQGDDTQCHSPTVIKDNGVYKMWYTGSDGGNVRIYFATSYNGIAWSKYNNATPASSDTTSSDGRIPLGTGGKGDDEGVGYATVIKDGSDYKMWYSGYDGTSWRIYHATSTNGGLTWSKQNNTTPTNSNTTSSQGRIPLGTNSMGDASHAIYPCVIKDGNTYRMWYTGWGPSAYRILYATSTNGLDWTKADNTIPAASDGYLTDNRIPLGNSGKGDDGYVYAPYVIKDGGMLKMWYVGYDGEFYRIYHALRYDDPPAISSGWHHVVGVKSGTITRVYVNGSEVTASDIAASAGSDGDISIGAMLNGSVDELAVYDRALSDEEITNRYIRGAVRLKFQARSSDNPPDGTFAGPDGTAATYYSELSNNTTSPPSFSLTNVADNRRFQYKAFLETDNSSLSPEINSITVDYTIIPPSGTAFKLK